MSNDRVQLVFAPNSEALAAATAEVVGNYAVAFGQGLVMDATDFDGRLARADLVVVAWTRIPPCAPTPAPTVAAPSARRRAPSPTMRRACESGRCWTPRG